MNAPQRPRAAIAGAGVLGRYLAWRLAHAGWQVSVFDPAVGPQAPRPGLLAAAPHAAGFTAAGMLSPLAELDQAEPEVAVRGWRSLVLWDAVARELAHRHPDASLLLRREDSLMLAHPGDQGAAQRVLSRLESARRSDPVWPPAQALNAAELRALEPDVAPGMNAWRLPGEGQILGPAMLEALHGDAPHVAWHWQRPVRAVEPGGVHTEDGQLLRVDLAIDARGLGARPSAVRPDDSPPKLPEPPLPASASGPLSVPSTQPLSPSPLTELRGVRGEVVWLHAPGVALSRPLRLLHPRHRVYLVPRPGDVILLGASEIDSEDRSGVSLRSAVELMTAAHSVLPALAEARILHLETNLRPALPDHRPWVHHQPGLLAINGLFRHGWLLAPSLAEEGLALATGPRPLPPLGWARDSTLLAPSAGQP